MTLRKQSTGPIPRRELALILAAGLAVALPILGQNLEEIESRINAFVGAHNPKLEVGYWRMSSSGRWAAYIEQPASGLSHGAGRYSSVHILDLEKQAKIRTLFVLDWSWDADDGLWCIDDRNKLFRFLPQENESVEIHLSKEESASKEFLTVTGVDSSSALVKTQNMARPDLIEDLLLVGATAPPAIKDRLPGNRLGDDWYGIYFLDRDHFAAYAFPLQAKDKPVISIWQIRPFQLVASGNVPLAHEIEAVVGGWQPLTALAVACPEGGLSPVVYLLTKRRGLERFAWPGYGNACAMREGEYCLWVSGMTIKADHLEFLIAPRTQDMPRLYFVGRDGTMTCE